MLKRKKPHDEIEYYGYEGKFQCEHDVAAIGFREHRAAVLLDCDRQLV